MVFFPQLIAGPIVLHREMARQVTTMRAGQGLGLSMFGPGVFLFAFGLFKKICLADDIAGYADKTFLPGLVLQTKETWAGVLA